MLLTILVTELTLLFNTLICHVLFERRKSISFCIYAYISLSIVISLSIAATLAILGRTSIAKYVYIALTFCYILYLELVYKESLPIKLFTMLSAWILTNIILLPCVYIIDKYFPVKSHSLYVIIIGILRTLIQVIILLLSYVFLRKKYKQSIKLIDNKTSYLICLYSIAIVLYLFENFDFESNRFVYNSFMNILSLVFFVIFGYMI